MSNIPRGTYHTLLFSVVNGLKGDQTGTLLSLISYAQVHALQLKQFQNLSTRLHFFRCLYCCPRSYLYNILFYSLRILFPPVRKKRGFVLFSLVLFFIQFFSELLVFNLYNIFKISHSYNFIQMTNFYGTAQGIWVRQLILYVPTQLSLYLRVYNTPQINRLLFLLERLFTRNFLKAKTQLYK